MSDEESFVPPGGEGGEKPPVVLGIPEKQPRDLGVHKITLGGEKPEQLEEKAKAMEGLAQSITMVQDEYCSREKESEKKNKEVRTRLISASVICLIFIGLEFAGGYFSNSLVIAADATQLLTVFATMMVSLFALKVSGRRPNSASLAWPQASALLALASVLATWGLTSVVMYLAYRRLCQEKFTIDVDMMLATSAFGVVANLVMGMVLHNNCHVRSCHGGGAHDPTDTPIANLNVRAAFLHVVCDFLFSLGVFITALFIDCCPDWHIVDPIGTLVFSAFVLFITLTVLRDVINVVIEGLPKGVYFNDVLKTFLSIEGVQQVQDLRLWAHSLDKIALSAHLTLRPGADHNEVLKIASRKIHAKFNFYEMTLHVEAFQDEASVEPILEKK